MVGYDLMLHPGSETVCGDHIEDRAATDPVRPVADTAVSTFQLDDELILYHGVTGRCFALNHTGAFVWSLCDGSLTADEIANDVALVFSIARGRAFIDVQTLLKELLDEGLLLAD